MSVEHLTLLPEWAAQDAIWIGWPSDTGNWPHDLAGARAEIAALVRACTGASAIHLVAGNIEAARAAADTCGDIARIHTLPMGDIWLRDTGPVYAINAGELVGLTFSFNGWGERFVMAGDTDTASAMLSALGHKERRHAFVLEGGSIDHDGTGVFLTTRQCLLNGNRNPGWTEATASVELERAFGAQRIIWLGDGLVGDHTDGHVDNLARFIGPGRVVCQHPTGADDPNAAVYAQAEADLVAAGLDIVSLPSPGRVLDQAGDVVAASHLNFIFVNDRVILPVYDEMHGETACQALGAALPDHDIIALPSRHILSGGGSFHCISQQMPALASGKELPS